MHRNNVADTPTLYHYGGNDLLCHYTLFFIRVSKVGP